MSWLARGLGWSRTPTTITLKKIPIFLECRPSPYAYFVLDRCVVVSQKYILKNYKSHLRRVPTSGAKIVVLSPVSMPELCRYEGHILGFPRNRP